MYCIILLSPQIYSKESDSKKSKNLKSNAAISKIRPEKWAQKIEISGLPNFHKVSDALYRGAQPDKKGMEELKKMGIKTIINLRTFHSDRDEIDTMNFNYIPISAQAWKTKEKVVLNFLKTVTDTENQPVFVHCQHGADRTGTMCAIYRIAVQNWTKEDAIEEMVNGGFGYHTVWKNLISYIKKVNIEKLQKKSGIKN